MSETQQTERPKAEWASAGNAPIPSPTASFSTQIPVDRLSAAVSSAVKTPRGLGSGIQDLERGTEDLELNPAPALVDRIASSAFSTSSPTRFDLRQQWEGTIVDVGADSFTVTLKDLTDPSNSEESAELFLEDIGESDRDLVEPGAVFYWSVGYEDTSRGRERKSIIRFRRLPGWSRQEMDAVKAKTDELSSYFVGAAPPAAVRR